MGGLERWWRPRREVIDWKCPRHLHLKYRETRFRKRNAQTQTTLTVSPSLQNMEAKHHSKKWSKTRVRRI